ncbi:DUF2863 family protein [Undibacterium oligocarboniphilum]|uniref:DUF2863 family protein n=1 Tax=Undibacterium oligocarboniphilum TaxID=666702 RepID=A0A850QLM8_9BURK|nr:DUF2863 family protein [Undibacterium oligocarboniphilum]MBC3870312.1 DUF2863 family protein [Undibacterium oligocarboniphilum]NVO78303.1 DUF2863 family protein [Undibacterium oligocarboniphilum]
MRRPVKRPRLKLAAESQRLSNLALAVAQSSSRLEDLAWQEKLDASVAKNLRLHHQDLLDAAAEHLFTTHPNAYEVFVETLETCSTSAEVDIQGKKYQALLIAAPVLAWTRFEIASGIIPAELTDILSMQLKTDFLTPHASLRLLPHLYSIDQLPRNHCETYAVMEKHALSLLKGLPCAIDTDRAQTVPFLADIRYVLGVVVAPVHEPLFLWQTIEAPYDCAQAKSDALLVWESHAATNFKQLLPGCGTELLLPEAFYTACREADIRIRPVSVRSAVFYLAQTLSKEPDQFSVIIASFGAQETPGQVDEFRLSFCLKDAPEVIYGVVWPLYQAEDQANAVSTDEHGNLTGDIPEILTESGITSIKQAEEIFAMEFCDDCGIPLFADQEGELVHPEMPENTPAPGTAHFH